MKLFKKLIPQDEAQEVTILQSWTLKWEIQGAMYMSREVFHKTFIKKDEAYEYEKQLKAAAKFLGTWVDTYIYEN
mgnify:CR=1 FL=1